MLTHSPAEDCCSECGGALRKLGENAAEQPGYIPHSFKVIRYVRPRLRCTGCDKIVQVPAPSRAIDRGLAGPRLLAFMLIANFANHIPLSRQSEICAHEGVAIIRSTLAGCVGATSPLLMPLVEAVCKHGFATTKLHANNTPVPVLAPGASKTKTGRLWIYVRDDRPSVDASPPAV